MTCAGREGSKGCSENDSNVTDQPWVWVGLTIGLWIAFILTVIVIRTCSKRQRRHRFLNKVVRPVLGKIGVLVTWGSDEEAPPSPATSVHCVMTDMPPAYWTVVLYNNEASSGGPLDVTSLPTYDEVVAMTSIAPREGAAGVCTSQRGEDSDASQTGNMRTEVNGPAL